MTLQEKVSMFCARLFADPDAVFTAASLTTAYIDSRRNWPDVPADMQHAVYLGIQQIVRPFCRDYVREDPNQIPLDLPEEALLQERYSVPVGKESKYVPRHLLTEFEVKLICDRDRKLSQHFARRADALEAWFYRKQAGAA